jgi:hypothetical protein
MHLYENNKLCLKTLEVYQSCVSNGALTEPFEKVCADVKNRQERLSKNIKFFDESFKELLNIGFDKETKPESGILKGIDFMYKDKMLDVPIEDGNTFSPFSKDREYIRYFNLWKQKINTCNMERLKVEETDSNLKNMTNVANKVPNKP